MDENIAKLAKEIWTAQPEPKIQYDSFIERLERLAAGSPVTIGNLAREAGILPPVPSTVKEQTTRPFVAYDGEGFGDKYTILANSLGETIEDREGLDTDRCLAFLARRYSGPIFRVFYGFDYDVNHIIAGLPSRKMAKLLDGNAIKYKKWSIKYVPGKIFVVNNIQYYDVISYFQRSFIKSVELMLGKDAVSERLIAGKQARGNFDTWATQDIIDYNAEELDLLVEIMERFRTSLLAADVHLTQWYGPGTIANFWLRKHGIQTPANPEEVETALDHAYYGGRFEQIRLGKVKPVWEYDIRSAYPAAMAAMPDFVSWWHPSGYIREAKYAIWKVEVDLRHWYMAQQMSVDPLTRKFTPYTNNDPSHSDIFLPLPMRNKQGTICFPLMIRGWYWSHEFDLIDDFFPEAKWKVTDGYIAEIGDGLPFAWVEDMYNYRQELKAAGNLAEYGVKVGLNSMYGKTAQRVGKARYHSLAWAGYITSRVRTRIARAGYTGAGYKSPYTNASKIIGFATDAIFSDHKLDLPISTRLGDWEESKFTEGLFIQSGVYRLRDSTRNEVVDRYRGNPMRDGLDDVINQLRQYPVLDPVIHKQTFVSHKLANMMPNAYGPYRLQFIRQKQNLYIDISMKRHYKFPPLEVEGIPLRHLGYMLENPIYSLPKIHMNVHNFTFRSFEADMVADAPDDYVESYPPKRSASRTLDDLSDPDADSEFDDIDSLLSLPEVVVETKMS